MNLYMHEVIKNAFLETINVFDSFKNVRKISTLLLCPRFYLNFYALSVDS